MSDLRMPAINQVTVAGRLVQDPEFRITDNGTARLTSRIAVNRAYRDRNDEWQEETSFFNIVIWNQLAERLADRLKKGTPVFLSGRLRSASWRDDDETPHYLVEIQARSLQVLERISENTNGTAPDDVTPDLTDDDQTDDDSEMSEAELALAA
jgi:single-strand DNA-binding protein